MQVKSRFHEQIDLESLRPNLDLLVKSGDTATAIEQLQKWIIGNPLDEKAFLLLGELYEQVENTYAAIVAFQRAMELKELSANYEPSPSLRRYQKIQEQAANDPLNEVSLVFDLKTHLLERSIHAMPDHQDTGKVSI
jgi:DNA-binding SARP family transcriptional activator